jgi:hypothetical protein
VFDARSSSRSGGVARGEIAVIHLNSGTPVAYPPLGADHDLDGLARLCAQYGIDWADSERFRRLAVALGREYRPRAFLPGGRKLTKDEQAISLWILVDQERMADSSDPHVVAKLRPILCDYGIIDGSEAPSTLERFLRRGNKLAKMYDLHRFRPPKMGAPRKK